MKLLFLIHLSICQSDIFLRYLLYIPSVLIAIVLVAAGFILIAGKKKQLVMPENAADVVAKEVFTAIETKASPVQDDQKAKEA